ncbi:amidohydrolase [Sinanaerobacter chloroacetimidivorans]|uniref:Amidohydrolase n=1 Tax=Sinanaerobacter chloroacetimidivorans TaxID=2818044 RepID=A0A8J7W0G3_9FIRM|nr:amidohydrolase [Sinanaerobacter chloroacetimidivorans]MBR0597313.1 amidohydrolase [Sinanaerobacter chloroacetimidivorans]
MGESISAHDYLTATLVLKNGAVYTMDDKDTVAAAVAVHDDKIIYVGNDMEAERYIGKDTVVINLEGKMVAPGFVDGHIHAASEQVAKMYCVYLADTEPTIDAYQTALREFAEKNPEAPIIFGLNFQINAFDDGPTKEMLDQIVSDKPVVIADTSYHAFWLNSQALKEIGVTKETKTPAGGRIVRDSHGEPTGYLIDCQELWRPLEESLIITPDQYMEAFQMLEKESMAKGITAVNSLGVELSGEVLWKTISDYAKTGRMTLRTNYSLNMAPEDDVNEVIKTMRNGQQYVSDLLNVTVVKLFTDGVVEGKTAYLLDPYAPETGLPADFRGEPIWEDDELKKAIAAIDKAGFQVHIHAIGDGAACQSLDAIEYAFNQNGKREARHTLTHLTIIHHDDILRMGEMGVIAAMQPIWFYKDPLFSEFDRQMLGEERFWQMYAIRDMLDAGILMTGSSDSPTTPDNRPLAGIETAVTQCSPYEEERYDESYVRNPDQRVTVLEMLKVYTINGAKQMFMDKLIGSIEIGKKADMVILEEDITHIRPQGISETKVICTIFDGKIIYLNN